MDNTHQVNIGNGMGQVLVFPEKLGVVLTYKIMTCSSSRVYSSLGSKNVSD